MTTEHHENDVTSRICGAVITVSDRCSRGEAEDRSGPLAVAELETFCVEVDRVIVVPDEIESIRAALQEAIDAGSRVIVTTGGTGITPRDVTPEASKPFISLPLDGLAQQVRLAGLEATPLATLSRGLIGVTARGDGAALIVNAPGSPGGVQDAIGVVGPLIDHILGQLSGRAHEQASAERASTEQASTERASTEQASTERASVEAVGAEWAGANGPSAEQASTEQASTEQADAGEARANGPSAEQASTEQASTEQADAGEARANGPSAERASADGAGANE